MTNNLKELLEPFRLNPATGLPEVAEVVQRTDSNYHKEARKKLAEEAP